MAAQPMAALSAQHAWQELASGCWECRRRTHRPTLQSLNSQVHQPTSTSPHKYFTSQVHPIRSASLAYHVPHQPSAISLNVPHKVDDSTGLCPWIVSSLTLSGSAKLDLLRCTMILRIFFNYVSILPFYYLAFNVLFCCDLPNNRTAPIASWMAPSHDINVAYDVRRMSSNNPKKSTAANVNIARVHCRI